MDSLRVLLIDEDRDFLDQTGKMLSGGKYSVATASDFEDASVSVNRVKGRTIVLSGLNVGKKDGIAFLRETLKKYPHVPFTFLAASPTLESVIEALKQGAYDFLRKPVDPVLLLHSVARAVEKLNLSLESEKLEKETHDRLSRLQSELKQSRISCAYKGFLVSMVGHDFKSILTVLDGYMQIMNEKCSDCSHGVQSDLMVQAGRTLTRLRTMAGTLLDYEAAEAGKLQIEPKAFDLATVLRECAAFYRPYAQQKRVGISVEEELPRLMPKGDPERVLQILDNLIYNAIKFTPSNGEIRIGASAADGKFATVWIRDTGIGIPKSQQEKIFTEEQIVTKQDAFARIGLGLSICKKLLEIQGGKIWLESEPGKGTKVMFNLPL